MRFVKYLATLVGAAGLAASPAVDSASAQALVITAEMEQEAEAACRRALEEDTIEALEAFLRDYQWASTSCLVLAQNALGQNAPGGGGPGDGGGPGGGYGG
ncbi:MAG: hypothetical protein AB3N20_18330 [Rhizobiaceae bacterium]